MKKSLILLGASCCAMSAAYLLKPTDDRASILAERDTKYQRVSMDTTKEANKEMEDYIKVYRDSIASKMGEVLCYSDAVFISKRPESNIMRLISDALLAESRFFARANRLPTPDLALFNVGGTRDDLPMGPITVLHVFQVSPFENYAVILEADSAVVAQTMEHVAERGGEAIAGASFRLTNGHAEDIKINGEPLRSGVTYHLATLDYLAEGGDSFFCLTGQKKHDTGILFREMLMNYFRKMGALEQHLKPSDVERIHQ